MVSSSRTKLGSAFLAIMFILLIGCGDERNENAGDKYERKETATVFLERENEQKKAASRPNILLIVADDLGWSDIGAYGGEIITPNIDSLVETGMQFTNFHVNTTCSPTRSMLFSGVDSHIAGYGTMPGLETPEQKGKPGYEVFLNDRVVTFPKLLQDAGYHTYIAGKWDQGGRNGRGNGPHERGFDKSYVLIEGLADHFRNEGVYNILSPVTYVENGDVVDFPEDFFSTRTYADKILEYIDSDRPEGEPFFAMLSFTAPHYPLQAHDDDVGDYEKVYTVGYQEIRKRRLERQRALGLIGDDWVIPEIHESWPVWEELDPGMQALEVKRMAAYAGMITAMDRQIGRIVSALDKRNLRDNTLIIFMSDNGPEQSNPLDTAEFVNSLEWMENRYSFDFDQTGKEGSFTWTGPAWASVSSTPWAFHKHFMTRGGVNVPFVASFPNGVPSGSRSDAFVSVLDLMPTFLELAGTNHPGSQYNGRSVATPSGASMVSLLANETDRVHGDDYVYGLELFDRRMIQKGDWKIVWSNPPWGKDGAWSLYNLAKDPAETRDLADQLPEKLDELIREWDAYVIRNGVILNPGYVVPLGAKSSHLTWRPPDWSELRAAEE